MEALQWVLWMGDGVRDAQKVGVDRYAPKDRKSMLSTRSLGSIYRWSTHGVWVATREVA